MSSDDESLDGKELIPVRILGIYPYGDPNDARQLFETFLVFLKGNEDKVVPISIGRFEGQALAMAMRKLPPARPLPYNLLKDLLQQLDCDVVQLVIHTLKDEVFHAYIEIQKESGKLRLDCRPSDGMTLATLSGVPIYISTEIVQEAGRELDGLLDGAELGEEQLGVGSQEDEIDGLLRGEESDGDEELSELEKLRAQLNRLVAEEAYEEAAKVRDLISRLVRQP